MPPLHRRIQHHLQRAIQLLSGQISASLHLALDAHDPRLAGVGAVVQIGLGQRKAPAMWLRCGRSQTGQQTVIVGKIKHGCVQGKGRGGSARVASLHTGHGIYRPSVLGGLNRVQPGAFIGRLRPQWPPMRPVLGHGGRLHARAPRPLCTVPPTRWRPASRPGGGLDPARLGRP